LLVEPHFFPGSFIVKTAHVVTANRPMKGSVAFASVVPTTAALKSLGGCASALHSSLPASYQQLDRNEGEVHPGEGSA
jgi:hypothetical protein